MHCELCGRAAPVEMADVIDEGWISEYFAGEDPMEGPVCPECVDQHLRLDDDGEWVVNDLANHGHRR